MRRLLLILGGLKAINEFRSFNKERSRRQRSSFIWSGVGIGMGLGALLMYILDPVRGPRRRSLARDRVIRIVHKTGDALDATTRDLRNRAIGAVAEMRNRFAREQVDDDVLVARVRSRMGRVVSHPHSIDVTATDGHVTLRGQILAREVKPLLRAVRFVRGVRSVENQLDIQESQDGQPSLQGGRRRPGMPLPFSQERWSPTSRLVAGLAGSGLVAYGARRRDAVGLSLGTVGLGLVTRGLTNLDTSQITGIRAGRGAIRINKTINIDAPIEDVFGFWANFENFPLFMRNVREVRDQGNGISYWKVAGPAGTTVHWQAKITDWKENEVIAWRSLPDAVVENSGTVKFFTNPDGTTRVDIHMSYTPPAGAIGHAVASLFGADPKKEMDEDLNRMKTMIETGNPPHDAADPLLRDIQESH